MNLLRRGVLLALAVALTFGASRAADRPLRALVVYGGHGFPTNEFMAAFRAMPDVEVEFDQFPRVAARLRPGLEGDFDVLVRYDMFGPASEEERRYFLALIETGIGLVALHHAIASHPDWPDYARLIGGGKYLLKPQVWEGAERSKSTYSHGETVPVRIADRTHPIVRGVEDFIIHDETYGGDVGGPGRPCLVDHRPPEIESRAGVGS